MRTKIDGMCRWPSKRVIEAPQQASKTYTPRKYVIHRCSDDTACCGSLEKTCVAKREEQVTLWFHVRYVSLPSIVKENRSEQTVSLSCSIFRPLFFPLIDIAWPQEEANYKIMMNRSGNAFSPSPPDVVLKVKTNRFELER